MKIRFGHEVHNFFTNIKGAKSPFVYFEKKWLYFSKSLFPIRFNLRHPQPSLFLFTLESPLWCFSSLVSHYFWASQNFNRNLGRRRNDSKYRDVAPLSSTCCEYFTKVMK